MRKSLLISLTLAAAAIAGCSDDGAETTTAAVVVQTVAMAPLQPQSAYQIKREFAGLVVPAQSTDLGFELSGKIAQFKVNEGDQVKAGDVLAVLDLELLRDQRAELLAQSEEILASSSLNLLNNKRINDLESRGFASKQRSDELSTEGETLLARQAQVQAALQSNQTRMDKSRLLAPFDSAVSDRFVDRGAVVDAGTPVLRLLQSSNPEARVGVPVRLRDSLSVGQSVELLVAGQVSSGRVITVGQNVTRATLTVPVRIALAPSAQGVYGDQAYLKLFETVPQSGYWVPLEALTEGLRGLWNVYVAIADNDTFVVQARDVRVLHAEMERAYIAGALAGDELLIQSGLHRLVPGQRVAALTQSTDQRVSDR